jgi:cytochrome c2
VTRALLLATMALLTACHAFPSSDAARRGRAIVIQAQCGACHQVPGVMGATGEVGPPLSGFARRTMIAGLLPNTPDNLTLWLRYPQRVVPGNAMPDMGLSEDQARDVAAYLDTLK